MRSLLSPHRSHREKGAVLITVLLLVTFMSALAISMMDDLRIAIKQTATVRLVNQAHWFARGAEQLAEQAIAVSWSRAPGRSTLNDAWSQGPTVFPVDGGYIEGQIVDRSNCFNLNSIVDGDDDGRYKKSETGADQYFKLLLHMGFNERDTEELVSSLADWVDSDTAPTNRGAEDAYYMTLGSPYRAANTLLIQATELRAVRGYTEPAYQRILPFVCALPHSNPSLLNVNTLMPEQVPLLMMLIGDDLTESAARQVILERPTDGFLSLQQFWAHRGFAGLGISEQIKSQVSVRTRYFESRANVVLGDAYVTVTTLFEQASDGQIKKVARHQGMLP